MEPFSPLDENQLPPPPNLDTSIKQVNDSNSVSLITNMAKENIASLQSAATERKDRKAEKRQAKQLRAAKSKDSSKETTAPVIPKSYCITSQDILKLRFSQDSISNQTKEGIPIGNLIANMKSEGWKNSVQLEVVRMPDGDLVSLNNRRLYAARKAATEKPDFKIKVAEYSHDAKAPIKLLRGVTTEYIKWTHLSRQFFR